MRRGGALALALATLCLAAAPARSQAAPPRRFAARDSAQPRAPAPVVGLLSAAVPGAGEYLLGLNRWVPQLALEAFAWWQYRSHRQQGRDLEVRYRRLACEVARRIDTGPLCRDSSDFEYYETMGKPEWAKSGAYDADGLTSGVQPETDPTTYNGSIWVRAQRLYDGPTGSALGYYDKHAIPPGFRWDWGDNGLEQTTYDELIHRGDAAFRTSSEMLGFILANHVASGVDAYIAARLRELARAPSIEVRTGFEPAGGAVRWRAGVRIGSGRR